MQSHEMKAHAKVGHLSHLNFLFTGWGSHIYDLTMVRLTRTLYQRVIEDMVPLRLGEGKVLDAGTGPGTLARRRQMQSSHGPQWISPSKRNRS